MCSSLETEKNDYGGRRRRQQWRRAAAGGRRCRAPCAPASVQQNRCVIDREVGSSGNNSKQLAKAVIRRKAGAGDAERVQRARHRASYEGDWRRDL